MDGIAVGSAVIPIQSRLPMVLAQQALTLDLIAPGRFKLGIGMTHAMVTEGMWGIPWDRPVRRLNEYLDGLVALLHDQKANSTGETATTRGALMIPGAGAVPVYVAALGPQLLKVTGRRTAGPRRWPAPGSSCAGASPPDRASGPDVDGGPVPRAVEPRPRARRPTGVRPGLHLRPDLEDEVHRSARGRAHVAEAGLVEELGEPRRAHLVPKAEAIRLGQRCGVQIIVDAA